MSQATDPRKASTRTTRNVITAEINCTTICLQILSETARRLEGQTNDPWGLGILMSYTTFQPLKSLRSVRKKDWGPNETALKPCLMLVEVRCANGLRKPAFMSAMLLMTGLTPRTFQTHERGDIPGFLARNFATWKYIELVPTTILFENNDRGLPAMPPVSHLPQVPSELPPHHSLHRCAMKPVHFRLLCVETPSLYRLQRTQVQGSGINMGGADHVLYTIRGL